MHILLSLWKKFVKYWKLWKSNSKAMKSEDLEWESPSNTLRCKEWRSSSSDSGSILSQLKATKRWRGKPWMLGHFSWQNQSVQMLPHQESQVMPQYTNRLVKSQQLLPQQAVLCGGCSRHLPVGIDLNAGLQTSKLINMGGKGATGCLHLQNFLHGI